jgi:hypothetical protein
MIYLLNIDDTSIHAFDDTDSSQIELYKSFLISNQFIKLDRLPQQFEEWDGSKQCWSINLQKQQQVKRELLIYQVHELIEITNRFETSSFQAKYWTEEQEAEFELWRHKLFDVVYEGASDIPPPPDFVQQMLDGNAQLPQLLQSVATPEETKPKKRKTKSITE